jgi:hypothetical protein
VVYRTIDQFLNRYTQKVHDFSSIVKIKVDAQTKGFSYS